MNPRASSATRRPRGFSLLEVMLAFVLLTVGLGLLIAILGGGLLQVRQAGDATEATLHAQSLLDQIGAVEFIEAGESQGVLEQGRYRWEMRIEEIEDPLATRRTGTRAVMPGDIPVEQPGRVLGAPQLFRIQLDIGWGEEDLARSLRFVTLRVRQPPPEGVMP